MAQVVSNPEGTPLLVANVLTFGIANYDEIHVAHARRIRHIYVPGLMPVGNDGLDILSETRGAKKSAISTSSTIELRDVFPM